MQLRAEARERLRELLHAEGAQALDHAPRLRGLIADRLADLRREVTALNKALALGLPQRIRSRSSEQISPEWLAALAAELAAELKSSASLLPPEAARWAVDTWAYALGAAETQIVGKTDRRERVRPLRHLPWPAAIGLAGLLGAAVIALALGDDPPPPPPPTVPPESQVVRRPSERPPTPTVPPDLLAWIPTDIARTCVIGDTTFTDELARADCEARDADSIAYAFFPTVAQVYREYDALTFAPPRDTGSCPEDLPSEATWFYTATRDVIRGRYTCHHDDSGTAWIVTTADHATVLTWMTRADGDMTALFAVWRDGFVRPPADD